MLTASLLAGLLLVLGAPVPAASLPGDVVCPEWRQYCWVTADTPGSPGSGSSGASNANTSPTGTRVCVTPRGREVPCYSDVAGWFNDADGCYWKVVDPPPAADDPGWEGHYPDGAVYLVSCIDPIVGTNGGLTWRATPPPGYGSIATPAQLAQQAVAAMRLTGPQIHMTIDASQVGLVGVPLWLWTDVSPTTWGPNAATASVPGLAVTANAKATRIVWSMGDGHTQVCENPGTPYRTGEVHSPTCEYVYSTASSGQPNGAFPVTARTTWQVDWSGGGQSGSLTLTRSSSTSVRIGELQVLVTG